MEEQNRCALLLEKLEAEEKVREQKERSMTEKLLELRRQDTAQQKRLQEKEEELSKLRQSMEDEFEKKCKLYAKVHQQCVSDALKHARKHVAQEYEEEKLKLHTANQIYEQQVKESTQRELGQTVESLRQELQVREALLNQSQLTCEAQKQKLQVEMEGHVATKQEIAELRKKMEELQASHNEREKLWEAEKKNFERDAEERATATQHARGVISSLESEIKRLLEETALMQRDSENRVVHSKPSELATTLQHLASTSTTGTQTLEGDVTWTHVAEDHVSSFIDDNPNSTCEADSHNAHVRQASEGVKETSTSDFQINNADSQTQDSRLEQVNHELGVAVACEKGAGGVEVMSAFCDDSETIRRDLRSEEVQSMKAPEVESSVSSLSNAAFVGGTEGNHTSGSVLDCLPQYVDTVQPCSVEAGKVVETSPCGDLQECQVTSCISNEVQQDAGGGGFISAWNNFWGSATPNRGSAFDSNSQETKRESGKASLPRKTWQPIEGVQRTMPRQTRDFRARERTLCSERNLTNVADCPPPANKREALLTLLARSGGVPGKSVPRHSREV